MRRVGQNPGGVQYNPMSKKASKLICFYGDNPVLLEAVTKLVDARERDLERMDFIQRQRDKLIEEANARAAKFWREIFDELVAKGHIPADSDFERSPMSLDEDTKSIKRKDLHDGLPAILREIFEV